jgi:hypothetical protein
MLTDIVPGAGGGGGGGGGPAGGGGGGELEYDVLLPQATANTSNNP